MWADLKQKSVSSAITNIEEFQPLPTHNSLNIEAIGSILVSIISFYKGLFDKQTFNQNWNSWNFDFFLSYQKFLLHTKNGQIFNQPESSQKQNDWKSTEIEA